MVKITLDEVEAICYKVASGRVAEFIHKIYIEDDIITIHLNDGTNFKISLSGGERGYTDDGIYILGTNPTIDDLEAHIDLILDKLDDFLLFCYY